MHLPSGWTLNTEYDSEPGLHKADVIGYLNQGHHIVNHDDHCDAERMGVGWINHGELLTIPDVNALYNGNRRSLVFAIGCMPADFSVNTCIGEAWVKHPTGGAVSFIGNTRYGWGGSVTNPDHYTVKQDRLFYDALFDQGVDLLGGCFTYAKNGAWEEPDPYSVVAYTFTQLTLLSDPGLPIWTDDPGSLTVTHPAFVGVGEPATFPVRVHHGTTPVDGASVCLCKGNEVYEVRPTVAGTATFSFAAATTGTMFVTVSLHNYLPHQGQARVGVRGDFDHDMDVDRNDWSQFASCFTGPGSGPAGPACEPGDFDADGDIDTADFARFQQVLAG